MKTMPKCSLKMDFGQIKNQIAFSISMFHKQIKKPKIHFWTSIKI